MSDQVKYVTLMTADQPIQTAAILAALQEAGIDAAAVPTAEANAFPLPLDSAQSRTNIRVRTEQLDAARDVVAATAAAMQKLNWEEVDVGRREDETPLHPVGRMPLPARLGQVIAIAAMILLLGLMLVVIVSMFRG